MSIYCVRGCTTRGHHVTDCADRETCQGCLPRQVSQGQLCERCWTALTRDIALAPSLVRWLREHVEPGSPARDGRVRGSRVPPAPLSVQAVAAADDLHAMLSSWVLLILEEHPGGLRGPSWVGTRSTRTGRRLVVADVDDLGYQAALGYDKPAWASMCYDPPMPAGLAGRGDPSGQVCRWLLAHAGWAAAQEWAGEMAREVTQTTATLLARWPQEARSRPITDLPCPGCDRLSLVYYPVTEAKGSTLIQCEHHACGRRVDEDRWAWYAGVIADSRRRPA